LFNEGRVALTMAASSIGWRISDKQKWGIRILKFSRHKRPIQSGSRDFEEVGHFLAALAVLDEVAGVVGLLAG
jgi:hypothetical protein